MPNQLANSKRRQSLAESTIVLEALAEIARTDKTTVSDLIRKAVRDTVRQRLSDPVLARRLQSMAERLAPTVPKNFRSAAQVARFKRAQRDHDHLLLELDLIKPADVQARNSLTPSPQSVRVLNFATAHA
ncbi:MAG: hypothetical protein ACN6I3_00385 [bacterium]